jgi:hypothetical protein
MVPRPRPRSRRSRRGYPADRSDGSLTGTHLIGRQAESESICEKLKRDFEALNQRMINEMSRQK